MRTSTGVLTIAILAMTASVASSASLVTNGSFETPEAPEKSYTNFYVGNDMGGWSVVGPAGNSEAVSLVDGSFVQSFLNFKAQDGKQWVDLAGQDSNAPYGIQQILPTIAGQTYALSFWVGNVYDPNGFFKTSTTINVVLNGSPLLSATNSSSSNPDQFWENFVTTFVAAGPTTLAFFNGDASNDFLSGLDNVSVTLASETPLPAALPLFASTLIGGGVIAWRKRRKQKAQPLAA